MDVQMTVLECFESRLHHVGFVISDIEAEIRALAKSIDAAWDARIFDDPLQKVRVSFLRTSCPQDALIELVQPAGEGSPVLNFLNKGGGLHHLCYEVIDLETHLTKLRNQGAIVVKPPLPAVAFDYRRIAWVLTKQKLLLEFLEKEKH
jgi:methylmalonyl-CoA/ethylmalonyl-CoA epimerase